MTHCTGASPPFFISILTSPSTILLTYPTPSHEDTEHILLCSHTDSTNTWDKALSNLQYKLHYLDTCPQLLIAMSNDLQAWRTRATPPNIDHLPKTLRNVITTQRSIGWQQFLEGLISSSWSSYMDNYYRLSQTLKNGQTWTSRLYHLTWNLIFHIWEDRNNQLHKTERINTEVVAMTCRFNST